VDTNHTPRRYEAPWLAGLRAARANLLPGLFVQAIMLSLVLGYYLLPATRELLDHLAAMKARWGFLYSAVSAVIAGAVIPTLFATWGVWIPIVAALYALPPLLQIPLFSLALSLWVILFTWMSEQRARGGT